MMMMNERCYEYDVMNECVMDENEWMKSNVKMNDMYEVNIEPLPRPSLQKPVQWLPPQLVRSETAPRGTSTYSDSGMDDKSSSMS